MTDHQHLVDGLAAVAANYGVVGLWRHKASGHVYQVRDVAYLEADLSVVVTYEREGVVWVRPLDEFLDRFEAYQ
jgi:hypothetical protein